jgi:hypothetical protein
VSKFEKIRLQESEVDLIMMSRCREEYHYSDAPANAGEEKFPVIVELHSGISKPLVNSSNPINVMLHNAGSRSRSVTSTDLYYKWIIPLKFSHTLRHGAAGNGASTEHVSYQVIKKAAVVL